MKMWRKGVWWGQLSFVFLLPLLNFTTGDLSHVGCVKSSWRNSSSDLWFRPSEFDDTFSNTTEGMTTTPILCVTVCSQEGFRYAGVGGALSCLCGSGYGGTGSGECTNCTTELTSAGGFPTELICGTKTSIAVYDTKHITPSPPLALELVDAKEDALQIRWKPPRAANGEIIGYKITATPTFTYAKEVVESRSWEFSHGLLGSATLLGLTRATEYSVEVQALSGMGHSRPAKRAMWTAIGRPEPPPSPIVIWQKGGKMYISLKSATNSKGPITSYRLGLVDDSQGGVFNARTVIGWKEASSYDYSYYVVAEFGGGALPKHFTIGDNSTNGRYFNGPIPTENERHWHPTLALISELNNLTMISYSQTGHYQHPYQDELEDNGHSSGRRDVNNGRYGGYYEKESHAPSPPLEEETSGVVTALWVAVVIALLILLACIGIFLLLKYNLLPSKSSRSARREAHALRHQPNTPTTTTTPSTYHDEFANLGAGGYTHLAYIPEEDSNWGARVPLLLTSLQNIPRSAALLPTDAPSALPPFRIGRWGNFYVSSNLLLVALPSPDNKKPSQGVIWDEELFTALSSLLRPSHHTNVLGAKGFLSTPDSLFIALPHFEGEGGTLKDYLHRERPKQQRIGAQELILCGMGVAEGLFHLHSYQVTHGKLSAWTVLLPEGDWRNPKITGWGILAGNPPNKELDRRRWMSVEELHSRIIPPCDSWAFGILLWELVSLGGTPYGELGGDELKRRVERGMRPGQLESVGDGMYQLMLTCWQMDRGERPSAGSIACQLHEMLHTANDEIGVWGKMPVYQEQLEFTSTK